MPQAGSRNVGIDHLFQRQVGSEVSLLRHEVIKTTLPKAKELRRVAEPILTLGKNPSLANRRLAFARLRDRDIVTKLFDELGPTYAARNGGYSRILSSSVSARATTLRWLWLNYWTVRLMRNR